jgi:HD-GYP domain-containing protein (c-di-GMP phosphodiesterase class II)
MTVATTDVKSLPRPDGQAPAEPLTPEEFQKIRAHPKVGADIIKAVPFPYPVAPLIMCHHERWDGKGYPVGLKGEDVPLGARILSVVDS